METRLSKHEEGRGGGKGENTTEGATMAASWQDEELKKKKKRSKKRPRHNWPFLHPPDAKIYGRLS